MEETDPKVSPSKKLVSQVPFLILGVALLVLLAEAGYYVYIRFSPRLASESGLEKQTTVTEISKESDFQVPNELWGKEVPGKLVGVGEDGRLKVLINNDGSSQTIEENFDVIECRPSVSGKSLPQENGQVVTPWSLINKDISVSLNFDNSIRSAILYYDE